MRSTRGRVLTAVVAGITALLTVIPVALSLAPASADAPVRLGINSLDLTGRTLLGPVDPASPVTVGLAIDGRDEPGLARLSHDLYDRASTQYHRFLTPAQFTERFGVQPDRRAAILSWLTGGGLEITYQAAGGTYVLATGTAGAVSALFDTPLARVQGDDGRVWRVNTKAPAVPAAFAIRSVVGLDDVRQYRTPIREATTAGGTTPSAFPIPDGSVYAKELRSIYDLPVDNTGEGQRLSAIGWGVSDGVESDLRTAEAANGLSQVPFRVIHVGTVGTDTSGKGEWDLDSQASTEMAPGIAGMNFYFATDAVTESLTAATQAWVDDASGGLQASSSFGGCESFGALSLLGDNVAYDRTLRQGVVEGRTMFVSTGDNGAACRNVTNGVPGGVPGVEYPASSPWVVAVGGAVLSTTTDASGNVQRDQETAWEAGGGGISTFEARPAWQEGVLPTEASLCPVDFDANPQADPSGACRGLPDVAAFSGDLFSGISVYVDGSEGFYLGTSVSAPLWNGMWAGVNAAAPAASDGTFPGAGFAAPAIYANNADATRYANDFYDITIGANGYPATPGWDYASGWGTPDMTALMRDVVGGTTPTNPTGSGSAATPPPPPPPPSTPCPAPAITDPAGDTLYPGLDDVDVTKVDLAVDGATDTLRTTVAVSDLTDTPPPGGTGDHFEAGFTVNDPAVAGGIPFIVAATRELLDTAPTLNNGDPPATNVVTFELDSPGSGSSFPTKLADLTGSFDSTANTITIDLPASIIAAHAGPTTWAGAQLYNIDVAAQTEQAGALRLLADDAAAGSCSVTFAAPSAKCQKRQPPTHAGAAAKPSKPSKRTCTR